MFSFIRLVLQHHWHEEHDDILIFFLLSRNDNTSTAWVSKFEDNVLTGNAVEDINKERTAESDAHSTAIILAENVLLS